MHLKFIESKDELIIEENSNEILLIHKNDETDSDILNYYTEDVEWVLAEKICNCKAEDITNGFHYACEFKSDEFSQADWHEIKKENNVLEVKMTISFDWENWDNPIKIYEFLELYKEELNNYFPSSFSIYKDEGFARVLYKLDITEGVILPKIQSSIKKAKESYDELIIKIIRNKSSEIFVKVFNFPEGYESICSQYLIWFGEFLKNFGINVNVSTENDLNTTKLIVSPKNATVLTTEIENLFYKYLSLPYVEYLPSTTNTLSIEDKIKYQILANQIEFYKMQIQMKDSVLEMKEVTISGLKDSIEKHKKELLLISSMKDSKDIEMLRGVLSIGDIKWGAVKFSPKKLLEKLKKKV